MKTILARHADGPIVLKIFIKPDPSMSLRLHQRRLKRGSLGEIKQDYKLELIMQMNEKHCLTYPARIRIRCSWRLRRLDILSDNGLDQIYMIESGKLPNLHYPIEGIAEVYQYSAIPS